MELDEKPAKISMHNITINIPDNYEKNIQKLITMKLIPSRSEAIRTALREFLRREYSENLDLFDFFENNNNHDNFNPEEKKLETIN